MVDRNKVQVVMLKVGRVLLKNYIIIFAFITWIITRLFKNNDHWTEVIYSKSLYPFISRFLSGITNLIPISISDLVYGLLFLYLLSLPIVLIVKRKRIGTVLFFTLKVLALFYVLFYWLWGFNYFREPVYSRMNFETSTVDDTTFDRNFRMIIEDLKADSVDTNNFDKQVIDSAIEASYGQMATVLRLDYPNGRRRPENMLYSAYNASTGVSGYFGPFFNEIHMNKHLLPVQYPAILAHEKAHQFGITSEAEASFYAWMVCRNTNVPALRYSCNLFIIRYFIISIHDKKVREEYLALLPERALRDMEEVRNFWKSWRNPLIDKMQSKLYDWYLKGNNISDGLNNYGGVVKLICEYEQVNSNVLKTKEAN